MVRPGELRTGAHNRRKDRDVLHDPMIRSCQPVRRGALVSLPRRHHPLRHQPPCRVAGLCGLLAVLLAGCGRGDPGPAAPPLPDLVASAPAAGLHSAFAGPASSHAAPGLTTPPYPVAAAMLYRIMQGVVASRPRTTLELADDERLEVSYVVRSRVFGFRDRVVVQVSPTGASTSELRMYSRSLQGDYDFGVNQARVRSWLLDLDRQLKAGGISVARAPTRPESQPLASARRSP